jgi:hypothetical protein
MRNPNLTPTTMELYTIINEPNGTTFTFRGNELRNAIYKSYFELGIILLKTTRTKYEQVYKNMGANVIWLISESN